MLRVLAISAFFASLLTACALPRPEAAQQFVPDKELLAVGFGRQGLAHLDGGHFTDAELSFRRSLFLFPEARNIRLNLAQALMGQGLYDEARGIFEEFRLSAPESLDVLFALADLAHRQGDLAGAELLLSEAFKKAEVKGLKDKMMAARRSLASVLFEAGREEEAYCLSLEALQSHHDTDLFYAHQRLLMALGRYQRIDTVTATVHEEFGFVAEGRHLFLQAAAVYALGRPQDALSLLEAATAGKAGEAGLGLEMNALRAVLTPDLIKDDVKQDLLGRFDTAFFPPSFSLFLPGVLLSELRALVLSSRASE